MRRFQQRAEPGTKRLKAAWRHEKAVGETELPLKAWARRRPDGKRWLERKRREPGPRGPREPPNFAG